MKHRLFVAASIAIALSFGLLGAGAAADGGPTPGIAQGGPGVAAPDGRARYVAVGTSRYTVIQKIGTRDGRVLGWSSLTGYYGIPVVSWDGTTAGLTRDGSSLVLSTFPGLSSSTRLAVLETRTLRVRQRVTLQGVWSVDALSPDGSTVFLIQYLPTQSYAHYRVRAYDLRLKRLVAGSIVDKREPGPMTGSPVTRVTSRDGGWAYTLYSRPSGRPFVHALDTRHRTAVCVDLPWRHATSWISAARLTVSRDGKSLYVSERPAGRAAVVDTRTFSVKVSATV